MMQVLSRDWLRRRPAWRFALAALAGVLTVLGHAPVGAFVLALAAAVLLVHLWLVAPTPRAAAAAGYAFGLGLFGAGVSWVYVSMTRFGGMPGPIAAVATAGFCAYLALFPALAGWLQARWPGPAALRALAVIPALWTFTEWLRGWLLTGFPWLDEGYAAIDWPLAGYAPLGGVYAVSLATFACAGLIWCLANRAERRGVRRAAFAGLAVLLAAGAVLRDISWTAPAGAPFGASLLQGNVSQLMKFDPAHYAHTLETYARLAEESRARLIVLPETAVPRFLDLVDPAYLARLAAAARRNGGDLLLGVPTRNAAGEYFNSVVTLGSAPHQIYSKSHLVPFGEFVPPGFGWVVRWLSIPLSDFSAGTRDPAPLSVAGQRVAVDICYEDAYGEEVARQLPEATLLVNVSNVAWFGDSLAPAQHLAIARMRALETGRALLTATNTGITAAIGRDGRVLARLPQFVAGRLEVQVSGYRGATPYVRFGDTLALAAVLALLVLARVALRRGRRADAR